MNMQTSTPSYFPILFFNHCYLSTFLKMHQQLFVKILKISWLAEKSEIPITGVTLCMKIGPP